MPSQFPLPVFPSFGEASDFSTMLKSIASSGFWMWGLLGFGGKNVNAQAVANISYANEIFSQEWLQEFGSDVAGCAGQATDPYEWRNAGYGSNMNHVVLQWIKAVMEGRTDLAVIVNTEDFFPRTTCSTASNGVITGRGWSCIFAPVPHLCAFNTKQEWIDFNRQRGISAIEEAAADERFPLVYIRNRATSISDSLSMAGLDYFAAAASMYEYLHTYLQPWFKADVEAILREPTIAAVREEPYVSMHIRRADKIIYDGATKSETETYFENVARFLEASPEGLSANDIKGLWLSTDGMRALDEVKALVPKFFPNVRPESIISITDRVAVRLMKPGQFVEGTQDRNTYEATVLLRAEMEMMAGANVFSGTFSSNISRIIALMRHSIGKPRESALSADVPVWFPAL